MAYRPRRYRFEWLLLSAALLLFGAATVWSLQQQGQRLDRDENDQLQFSVRSLADLIGQRLLVAERVLSTLARDQAYWRGPPGEPALRLKALAGLLDGIGTLLIVDRAGRVLAASRDDLVGSDFSRREFFTRARQQQDARLLGLDAAAIGDPVLGTLAVSRAMVDERGVFAGIVWAGLDADFFRALMASVRYAPDVQVSVADTTGKPFLRLPETPASEALVVAQAASWFARHRDSGQPDSLHGTIDAGGEAMTIALRRLATVDQALLVAVARPRDRSDGAWYRLLAWHGGLFLLTLLASVGALYAVQRRQRRVDVVRAQLQPPSRGRSPNACGWRPTRPVSASGSTIRSVGGCSWDSGQPRPVRRRPGDAGRRPTRTGAAGWSPRTCRSPKPRCRRRSAIATSSASIFAFAAATARRG
jgi:hypothetical protein